MSFGVGDLFWWVPVFCVCAFFFNGCSADSCDFGVLVRGRGVKREREIQRGRKIGVKRDRERDGRSVSLSCRWC